MHVPVLLPQIHQWYPWVYVIEKTGEQVCSLGGCYCFTLARSGPLFTSNPVKNIGEEKMATKDFMFPGTPTLQLDPGSATGYMITMMLHVEPIIT